MSDKLVKWWTVAAVIYGIGVGLFLIGIAIDAIAGAVC